jgi:hypothetical protein
LTRHPLPVFAQYTTCHHKARTLLRVPPSVHSLSTSPCLPVPGICVCMQAETIMTGSLRGTNASEQRTQLPFHCIGEGYVKKPDHGMIPTEI